MSRPAQWALFGLAAAGALGLYVALMVLVRNDELVIYRLFPLYGALGAFGLTGLACLWATAPTRLSAAGNAAPRFPALTLLLILPVLLVPSLRRSTNLVRTAAVNGCIWAVLIALALTVRWVRMQDKLAELEAENRAEHALNLAWFPHLVRDRAARCQQAVETIAAVKRERPEVYIRPLTERCLPEVMRAELQLLDAGRDPERCREALEVREQLNRRYPNVLETRGDCPP